MAFDFLGNPKEEDLASFKEFLTEQLETIDLKIVSITNNINRLKLLREKAIKEFSLRKLDIPVDFGKDAEISESDEGSEGSLYDADAAVFMEEAKKPVVEAVKYNVENLENYMKRVFFSIDREERRLEDLSKGKDSILEKFSQAESLINKFNLIKKEKRTADPI